MSVGKLPRSCKRCKYSNEILLNDPRSRPPICVSNRLLEPFKTREERKLANLTLSRYYVYQPNDAGTGAGSAVLHRVIGLLVLFAGLILKISMTLFQPEYTLVNAIANWDNAILSDKICIILSWFFRLRFKACTQVRRIAITEVHCNMGCMIRPEFFNPPQL